jgi:hypothetical protein
MAAHISTPTSAGTVRVRLERSPHWLQLEIALDGAWEGGALLIYPDTRSVNLEGTDEISREYDLDAWQSSIMSGAFYAYRALKLPRRRLIDLRLQGSLGSEDMTALATAAALGVAKLLGAELPDADLLEWTVSISKIENGRPET